MQKRHLGTRLVCATGNKTSGLASFGRGARREEASEACVRSILGCAVRMASALSRDTQSLRAALVFFIYLQEFFYFHPLRLELASRIVPRNTVQQISLDVHEMPGSVSSQFCKSRWASLGILIFVKVRTLLFPRFSEALGKE
jgi:hypothetical protein